METLIDRVGDDATLALMGALVGLVFGISAQRSRFCLRASTVEVAEGRLGPRLSIWLIAFCTAGLGVQGAVALGWLGLSDTRALASVGSLSGAIIGGAMFGTGMILARGCASRLLILASSGNLRALVTGLVLTLVAQAAYTGALSPVRETLSTLWTIPGGPGRDMLARLSLSPALAACLAAVGLLLAFGLARRTAVTPMQAIMGMGVGLAVTLGWCLTYAVARVSFEVIPVSSVTFTGPATDTLMVLVAAPGVAWSFGIGLVLGVAAGAAGAATVSGEWHIERFGADTPMERYLIGAVLMGFGAMLAGGCAVGAGLSGGAAGSLTALVAVFFMWLSAMATHRLATRSRAAVPAE